MYLIGYDIRNQKRLVKVYKTLCGYATPIQYSIFLYQGSKKVLDACCAKVLSIIDEKEDDLRIFQLPENSIQWCLGKSFMPEGIFWTGLPSTLTG
ncbi:CRISPR-associated endonuclease Cas2 [Pasteurellaceae bacterium TAE3-ERU1]|nr:CRISPR-associated endonuclease Cas2 [Pasteurellaceae bacterium TAE3-ERU1]